MLGLRLFMGSEKSGLTVIGCKFLQEQRVLLVSPTLAELVKRKPWAIALNEKQS